MEVHVVSKHDNSQHATFTLPDDTTLPELAESSIRIRTQIVSLTSNNLTYARMGFLARWWDTYPVADYYPTPYNNPADWGIAPARGHATVEESNIPDLVPGTVLQGFWPTSAALTDLKLEASLPAGHWVEISEHRQKLMPLYNRYVHVPESLENISRTQSLDSAEQEKIDRLAWPSVVLCRAGNHLNEYVFPVQPGTTTPIHPYGGKSGLRAMWTAADGDVTSAVMVSLGASTKTALGFAYFFNRRPKHSAPLGFLQVTSSVDQISTATEMANPVFPCKAVDYTDISSVETSKWLEERCPSKIVILDFGARSNALDKLLELIKNNDTLKSASEIIVQIGSQQKVYTPEESQASRQAMIDLGKVQYNTSGIEDTAIELLGLEKFFNKLLDSQLDMVNHRHECAPGLELIWGQGVAGPNGISSGWDRLCKGQAGPNEGLVYRVQPVDSA
ncbi:hypothetical protein N7456_009790 [Penicillium angulare]|uniref:Uncharacterized protein n=1 Tax=Penicillium angulare TaxID=116970 RepID=A0A9W9K5K4_9EURO|nr:hypothetical protein N7456_009790 [Penicillium angulare]